ncbi:hypothetical protein [Methanopyrus sp. KOL6]|uniref:hypothetical protein n=1 Tax=Methanopyrus sp. KOL6 TaxID=1937004 RepID=UPI000B4ACB3E|nr:hypothetical protein [Methanopyrus sp. KOL6]
MRHTAQVLLIMFFAVTAPVTATSSKLQGDPYEELREDLKAMFPDPYYDAFTPGDVKLDGEYCASCKITAGVKIQPGVEAEGVLVVTRSSQKSSDIWIVNWNGWALKLMSIQEKPTDAAYATIKGGKEGIVLLAGPSENGVFLHTLHLSFKKYLRFKEETLYVPEMKDGDRKVIPAQGKVSRVRVLHVGYEYGKNGSVERVLFLIIYTVENLRKPVEEYGSDLYSALVRVDPDDNDRIEVTSSSIVNDFQHVTTFDVDVLSDIPKEYSSKYYKYQLGNRKLEAKWVAVAYTERWKECGVYLSILGYSPADDTYLPMVWTKLSDMNCSPHIRNVFISHTVLKDGTVVFLTVWKDGRDPAPQFKELLNPPPTGEVKVDGEVIWCQPAVLEVGDRPEVRVIIKNKPAAIVPKGCTPISLISICVEDPIAIFWLDVLGKEGIRSFPIPVAVISEKEKTYATPCVLAVSKIVQEQEKEKQEEKEAVNEVLWVFGTTDNRAQDPKLVPHIPLPEDRFSDVKLWELWASTLTVASDKIKSAVVVTTSKSITCPDSEAGRSGSVNAVIYETGQGTFVMPSVPIVVYSSTIRSIQNYIEDYIGGYNLVIPVRYRMIKTTLNLPPGQVTKRADETVFRIRVNTDYGLITTSIGLYLTVVVKRLNEVVGSALVDLSGRSNPMVSGNVEKVKVHFEGHRLLYVDVWVKLAESGVYVVEASFSDSLGRLMGEVNATTISVPRTMGREHEIVGYVPPRLGVEGKGSSKGYRGVTFPTPFPIRVRIRKTRRGRWPKSLTLIQASRVLSLS